MDTDGVADCVDPDVDGDGDPSGSDCDDADPDVHAAAPEACDGADNDCDGLTDESNALGCETWYRDEDGDGWGSEEDAKCLCQATSPWDATTGGDCDDDAAGINPQAHEGSGCDGVDEDCNGATDETFVPSTCGMGECVAASTCVQGVESCTPAPGPEPDGGDDCDGVDGDCDGATDEDFTPAGCVVGVCDGTTWCDDGTIQCDLGGQDPALCASGSPVLEIGSLTLTASGPWAPLPDGTQAADGVVLFGSDPEVDFQLTTGTVVVDLVAQTVTATGDLVAPIAGSDPTILLVGALYQIDPATGAVHVPGASDLPHGLPLGGAAGVTFGNLTVDGFTPNVLTHEVGGTNQLVLPLPGVATALVATGTLTWALQGADPNTVDFTGALALDSAFGAVELGGADLAVALDSGALTGTATLSVPHPAPPLDGAPALLPATAVDVSLDPDAGVLTFVVVGEEPVPLVAGAFSGQLPQPAAGDLTVALDLEAGVLTAQASLGFDVLDLDGALKISEVGAIPAVYDVAPADIATLPTSGHLALDAAAGELLLFPPFGLQHQGLSSVADLTWGEETWVLNGASTLSSGADTVALGFGAATTLVATPADHTIRVLAESEVVLGTGLGGPAPDVVASFASSGGGSAEVLVDLDAQSLVATGALALGQDVVVEGQLVATGGAGASFALGGTLTGAPPLPFSLGAGFTVAGSLSLDGDWSVSGTQTLTYGGATLQDATITLSDAGVTVSGAVAIGPVTGAVSGTVTAEGDLTLTGTGDLDAGGYGATTVTLTLDDAGLGVAGELASGELLVDVDGTADEATGVVAGTMSVTLAGVTLADAVVSLASDGLTIAATVELQGVGTVTLEGGGTAATGITLTGEGTASLELGSATVALTLASAGGGLPGAGGADAEVTLSGVPNVAEGATLHGSFGADGAWTATGSLDLSIPGADDPLTGTSGAVSATVGSAGASWYGFVAFGQVGALSMTASLTGAGWDWVATWSDVGFFGATLVELSGLISPAGLAFGTDLAFPGATGAVAVTGQAYHDHLAFSSSGAVGWGGLTLETAVTGSPDGLTVATTVPLPGGGAIPAAATFEEDGTVTLSASATDTTLAGALAGQVDVTVAATGVTLSTTVAATGLFDVGISGTLTDEGAELEVTTGDALLHGMAVSDLAVTLTDTSLEVSAGLEITGLGVATLAGTIAEAEDGAANTYSFEATWSEGGAPFGIELPWTTVPLPAGLVRADPDGVTALLRVDVPGLGEVYLAGALFPDSFVLATSSPGGGSELGAISGIPVASGWATLQVSGPAPTWYSPPVAAKPSVKLALGGVVDLPLLGDGIALEGGFQSDGQWLLKTSMVSGTVGLLPLTQTSVWVSASSVEVMGALGLPGLGTAVVHGAIEAGEEPILTTTMDAYFGLGAPWSAAAFKLRAAVTATKSSVALDGALLLPLGLGEAAVAAVATPDGLEQLVLTAASELTMPNGATLALDPASVELSLTNDTLGLAGTLDLGPTVGEFSVAGSIEEDWFWLETSADNPGLIENAVLPIDEVSLVVDPAGVRVTTAVVPGVPLLDQAITFEGELFYGGFDLHATSTAGLGVVNVGLATLDLGTASSEVRYCFGVPDQDCGLTIAGFVNLPLDLGFAWVQGSLTEGGDLTLTALVRGEVAGSGRVAFVPFDEAADDPALMGWLTMTEDTIAFAGAVPMAVGGDVELAGSVTGSGATLDYSFVGSHAFAVGSRTISDVTVTATPSGVQAWGELDLAPLAPPVTISGSIGWQSYSLSAGVPGAELLGRTLGGGFVQVHKDPKQQATVHVVGSLPVPPLGTLAVDTTFVGDDFVATVALGGGGSALQLLGLPAQSGTAILRPDSLELDGVSLKPPTGLGAGSKLVLDGAVGSDLDDWSFGVTGKVVYAGLTIGTLSGTLTPTSLTGSGTAPLGPLTVSADVAITPAGIDVSGSAQLVDLKATWKSFVIQASCGAGTSAELTKVYSVDGPDFELMVQASCGLSFSYEDTQLVETTLEFEVSSAGKLCVDLPEWLEWSMIVINPLLAPVLEDRPRCISVFAG